VECVRRLYVSERQFVSDCDLEINCDEVSEAVMLVSVKMIHSGTWHCLLPCDL
jgi:hypothetical protein